MRRLFKILLGLLVVATGSLIFYFYFPKIWGSLVYPLKYEDLILKYAREYQLSPSLVAAVIFSESRFNETSVSPMGARGLMQIMPQTAARLAKTLGDQDFSISKLFEPERNIRYGTYYLRELIDRHQGDVDKALIAYNGGEEAVVVYEKRSVLTRETQGFVRKVKGTWEMYQKIYGQEWENAGLEELERQREIEMKRELEAKIEERQTKGEMLSSFHEAKWEFRIFWPIKRVWSIKK